MSNKRFNNLDESVNTLLNIILVIRKIIHFFYPSNKKEFLILAGAMWLNIATIFLSAYLPVLLKKCTNPLMDENNNNLNFTIYLTLSSYGIGWTAMHLISKFRTMLAAEISGYAIKKLTLSSIENIRDLEYALYIRQKPGALISIINKAVNAIDQLTWCLFLQALSLIAEIVLVCIIITKKYGFYSAAALTSMLLSYVAYNIHMAKYGSSDEEHWINNSKNADARISEVITNYELIHYNNGWDNELKHCEMMLEDVRNSYVKKIVISEKKMLCQNILLGSCLILSTLYFGNAVLKKQYNASDFNLVIGYFIQFMNPLSGISYLAKTILASIVSLEQYTTVMLNYKNKTSQCFRYQNMPECNGFIEFKNVSFSYDLDTRILSNISFKIKSHEITAITGKSGSGKSTIAKLLFRFYTPEEGRILIDEIDIKDYELSILRKSIVIVPQESMMLHDTAYNNLTYGCSSVPQCKIDEIIESVDLRRYIESLQNKYQSTLGDRGLKLSGGQKQRFAIARSLLKNGNIYIFDEITSSLDDNTRNIILGSIKRHLMGKTIILITHDLSVIKDFCNYVLVLDSGKVLQEGTHCSLMKKKGLYKQLWSGQNPTDLMPTKYNRDSPSPPLSLSRNSLFFTQNIHAPSESAEPFYQRAAAAAASTFFPPTSSSSTSLVVTVAAAEDLSSNLSSSNQSPTRDKNTCGTKSRR